MPEATLKVHTDTWIGEAAGHTNHGAGAKLWLRGSGSGSERRGLVFVTRPFLRGQVVKSATLRLYARDTWGAGSRTITVRRVTEGWKENRVTWNNRPSTDNTNLGTLAVGNLHDGDLVEIDVTDLYQDVSDGDPYKGLELRLSTDEQRGFYASDAANPNRRPEVDFDWGGNPYPPSNLHPSKGHAVSVAGPRLSWRFTDERGDTDQSFSQVQVSSSTDFSSPVYDSGKVANTRHSWPLAGNYTVPDGSTRYWRVRVWDGSNLVSAWSPTVSFTRKSKGTLTITNPPVPPGNIVEETTPPISWTFAGETQERAKVRLLEVFAGGRTAELFEWPEQKMSATSVTIPKGLIKTGKTFRAQVWIWSTTDREGIAGDPEWVYGQRDFTYSRSGTPTAIATLNVSPWPIPGGPGVLLDFTCATEPDWFALRIGGVEVLDRIDPDDVRVSSGVYQMIYWGLTPRQATNIEVERVVIDTGKAKHSGPNPIKSYTPDPVGIWLIDRTTGQSVQLEGDNDADISIGTSGEVLRPLKSRKKLRIIDAMGGFEGTYSGEVWGDDNRDTLLDIFGAFDDQLHVVAANLSIPIELELDFTVSPTPTPPGDRYGCSFAFYQAGDFFDIEGGNA